MAQTLGAWGLSHVDTVQPYSITPEIMVKMIFDCIEVATKGPSVVHLTDVDPNTKLIVAEWQRRNKKEQV